MGKLTPDEIEVMQLDGHPLIVHTHACDDCDGAGRVQVTCRYGYCRSRCESPCGGTAECETCQGEGFVADDDCACTRCQAAWDEEMERVDVEREVARIAAERAACTCRGPWRRRCPVPGHEDDRANYERDLRKDGDV